MQQGHVACFQWLIIQIKASLRLPCRSPYTYIHTYIHTHTHIYIYVASLFHFYFLQRISNQSATILFNKLLNRLPSLIVCYAFSVSFFAPFTYKYPSPYTELFPLLFSFFIYLNIACPLPMQTCRVLGVYPSHVGDRCLVRRQVNNHVSTKEKATMRCFCQVRMTPAPPTMKGFHLLTHLRRGG